MSTQYLNLISAMTVSTGYGQNIASVSRPHSDEDVYVNVPLPMLPLGNTNVVVVPKSTFANRTLSFDLTTWHLYDLETNRSVANLTFTTTNPTDPEFVTVAERYVREARQLGVEELAAWGVRLASTRSPLESGKDI